MKPDNLNSANSSNTISNTADIKDNTPASEEVIMTNEKNEAD